jgi:hypothetical protein
MSVADACGSLTLHDTRPFGIVLSAAGVKRSGWEIGIVRTNKSRLLTFRQRLICDLRETKIGDGSGDPNQTDDPPEGA